MQIYIKANKNSIETFLIWNVFSQKNNVYLAYCNVVLLRNYLKGGSSNFLRYLIQAQNKRIYTYGENLEKLNCFSTCLNWNLFEALIWCNLCASVTLSLVMNCIWLQPVKCIHICPLLSAIFRLMRTSTNLMESSPLWPLA